MGVSCSRSSAVAPVDQNSVLTSSRSSNRHFRKSGDVPRPTIILSNSKNTVTSSQSSPRVHSVTTVDKEILRQDSKGRKFVNHFLVQELLGEGENGIVRKCLDMNYHPQPEPRAMKIIQKSILKRVRIGRFGTALENVEKEIAIWKKMDHPHIVRLYEVIDDPESDQIYMISELMSGGSILPDSLHVNAFPVETARGYFAQLVDGLAYLHYQHVIHRDIKPSNLLVNRDGIVKIADFGVSALIENENDSFRNTPGTAAFSSPEMLSGAEFSGRAADVWACGVTLYIFLFGRPPFVAQSVHDIYNLIRNAPLEFPDRTAKGAKIDHSKLTLAKELLTLLLEKDPEKRIKISEVAQHPFVVGAKVTLHELPQRKLSLSEVDISSAISKVFRLPSSIKKSLFPRLSMEQPQRALSKHTTISPTASERARTGSIPGVASVASVSSVSSFAPRNSVFTEPDTDRKIDVFGTQETTDKSDKYDQSLPSASGDLSGFSFSPSHLSKSAKMPAQAAPPSPVIPSLRSEGAGTHPSDTESLDRYLLVGGNTVVVGMTVTDASADLAYPQQADLTSQPSTAANNNNTNGDHSHLFRPLSSFPDSTGTQEFTSKETSSANQGSYPTTGDSNQATVTVSKSASVASSLPISAPVSAPVSTGASSVAGTPSSLNGESCFFSNSPQYLKGSGSVELYSSPIAYSKKSFTETLKTSPATPVRYNLIPALPSRSSKRLSGSQGLSVVE